jgi:thiosulfate/3-mercaptopyruvate sulfurtransferase
MIRTGLLLTFGLLAQGSFDEANGAFTHSQGDLEPRGGILVSSQWLAENLHNPDLILLHASADGSDYQKEHIPGARLVLADRIAWDGETGAGVELRPFEEIRWALENVGVSDGSTVVVYGTNPMLAARLWMTLDVTGAGGGTPLFLDGGIQVWKEEGRRLTDAAPPVPRGSLTLRPDPEKLANAEWILARLGHDDMALVDARPDDEFTGADGGLGGRVNPGHIPNARQLHWERLIESRERPLFRPTDELSTLFKNAGADFSDTVVTYCQVGLRASVTYMVARMLGYDTRFFDGSWRDWGSRDYPHIARPRGHMGSEGG